MKKSGLVCLCNGQRVRLVIMRALVRMIGNNPGHVVHSHVPLSVTKQRNMVLT